MSESISSIDKALAILELFGDSGTNWLSLKEVQARIHLPKTTTYTILQVLVEKDYLEKSEITSQYRLGLKIISLATARINMVELTAESLPVLLSLQYRLHLTVNICALEKTEVIYLNVLYSSSFVKPSSFVSKRGPAYCSSPGKCLLSELSGSEIDSIFKDYAFRKYTDTTISSLNELKDELKRVRKQGFAENNGEQETSARSISVPIFGYNGTIIAAISICSAEMSTKELQKYLPEMRNAADQISRSMGFVGIERL